MSTDEIYMSRCLELARLGAGLVSPNPMVGCVIVHKDLVIGEGWHRQYGGPHAEVNAVNMVADKELLKEATVYVNLEPCSHYGKTPPCADLLIKHKVKEVVVGMIDPFAAVAGSGIRKLTGAGIKVRAGIMEKECHELNKRFITFHTLKRPYIILKWAQTRDRMMSPHRAGLTDSEFAAKRKITGDAAQKLVHRWRGEEDGILVGTTTAAYDNPQLNTRLYAGKNPVRITFDRTGRVSRSGHLFDGSQPTIVFTETAYHPTVNGVEYIGLNYSEPFWPQVFERLYEKNMLSLIVEGGSFTLASLIEAGLWDEAQVFETSSIMGSGVRAPEIGGQLTGRSIIDSRCVLTVYKNV